MDYTIETYTLPAWGEEPITFITIPDGDGIKVFPADESNPDFAAFVEANPDWNK